MKYIYSITILLTLSSCINDEISVVNMRVNHYMQSGVGVSPELFLQTQEGEQIGMDGWQLQYQGIVGFDYEWGFIYDLKVKKQMVDDPLIDGSSIEYVLEEILSKTKVDEEITFDITLKNLTRGIQDLVVVNDQSEYVLSYVKEIECLDLCEAMAQALVNEDKVTGVFTHSKSDTIVLTDLVID